MQKSNELIGLVALVDILFVIVFTFQVATSDIDIALNALHHPETVDVVSDTLVAGALPVTFIPGSAQHVLIGDRRVPLDPDSLQSVFGSAGRAAGLRMALLPSIRAYVDLVQAGQEAGIDIYIPIERPFHTPKRKQSP